jgi:hypothetical protein
MIRKVLISLACLAAVSGRAANFTVSTNADVASGSLRQAIIDLSARDLLGEYPDPLQCRLGRRCGAFVALCHRRGIFTQSGASGLGRPGHAPSRRLHRPGRWPGGGTGIALVEIYEVY